MGGAEIAHTQAGAWRRGREVIHGLVSIIIPVARESVYVAIDSLLRTTIRYPVECILAIDSPDIAEGSTMLDAYAEEWFHFMVLKKRTKLGATYQWNSGLRNSLGEYVVMAADDLVFKENWLEEAMAKMAILPQGIGVVGFNDLYMSPRHQTHFLFHRKFILDWMGGVLVTPHYHHYAVDDEIIARAARSGRYAYAENSIVQHNHYTNEKRPKDQWDELAIRYLAEDRKTLAERALGGYPSDYEAIIKE